MSSSVPTLGPRGPRLWIFSLGLLLAPGMTPAQPFHLPTGNEAIYQPGAEDQFFVGTPGRTWTSGTFGCVRSEGGQFHEGLDIRCLERDRRGEPTDIVRATADGVVAYVNRKAGLSNFGKYIILGHRMEGLELYSLYAHLSVVEASLESGVSIQARDPIGVMGRTANTRQRISRERAHVHFEINLLLTERFGQWWRQHRPGYRNDHGDWNGRALVGLDPRLLLLAQHQQGTNFSLVQFVRSQADLCRVWIPQTDFRWLHRHPALIRPNPKAEREGVAGYEVALTYAGLPFEVTPRAASECPSQTRFELLSVNPGEQLDHPCRRLIAWKSGRWHLTDRAVELLELMSY